MPIVLATGAPTASGYSYRDVLGEEYEFPVRYRRLVVSGKQFLYYRGSRGSNSRGAEYFGAGVIGDVRPARDAGRLVADLYEVVLFDEPVPLKDEDGVYHETGTRRGNNWANGVRRTSTSAVARVLDRAGLAQSWTERAPSPLAHAGRASAEYASAVERYSVSVAMRELAEEYGEGAVREMPPGNPGFDILAVRAARELHVEVKGTTLREPVFHLSEGQRRHSAERGSGFRLMVVYAIDLRAGTHRLAVCSGPLHQGTELRPASWTGRIITESTGAPSSTMGRP